jgi:glycosyltransferase involved in cell wall biosynthesis
MRLHVVNLPHTNTTDEFSWCAYSTKVKRFCDMMTSLDYEVILYGGPENDAAVTEHVVTSTEQSDGVVIPPFDMNFPTWRHMAERTIPEIRTRASKSDMLCLIGGASQLPIAQAIPELPAVEYGIGYSGVFSKFRVFESYAWMHAVLAQTIDAAGAVGRFYDRVIPNYFDVSQFPEGDGKGDYLFFIGRLIPLKGIQIVRDIQERTGLPLVVAGTGDTSLLPKDCEYMGNVLPAERAKLLGGARCTLVPTMYVEPFGGVAVESMLTGTPVITTDFGAFTETVPQGVGGYRCHDLGEFEWAVQNVGNLDRAATRAHAMKYDMNTIRYEYDNYFQALAELKGDGWYSKNSRPPVGAERLREKGVK